MNGLTPEEINSLEERASREPDAWSMMHFLQKETGMGYITCAAWAEQIRLKYGGTSGNVP
jgi:hypothetical protein